MISNVKKEWLFNKKISYLILDVKKEWVFNKKISDLFFFRYEKEWENCKFETFNNK